MTKTAQYYGDALYELARDEQLSAQILQQIMAVRGAFARDPEYIKLLSSPSIPKKERCEILQKDFSGLLQPYLLNFMLLLTERGLIREFAGCCDEYRRRYNEDNGILEVVALTAIPLSQPLSHKLRAKLEQVTGKTIDLSNRVDASVLGGIRLEMDGMQLDSTVRRKLNDIRETLSNTVL